MEMVSGKTDSCSLMFIPLLIISLCNAGLAARLKAANKALAEERMPGRQLIRHFGLPKRLTLH
jgi:hypothetical protein